MAKVMLVEDDNNLREIYEARLEAEGYDIVSASDGEEALVVAKAQKPDLVISDVMMPKISGFEMLDILRNTDGLKDVKVIMLTALGQAEDKTRADSLGADRYLVKSQVTLEDIIKATHQLLDDAAADTTGVPANIETSPVSSTPAPAAIPTSPVPTATPATPPVVSAPLAAPADPSATPPAAIPVTSVTPPAPAEPPVVEPTTEPVVTAMPTPAEPMPPAPTQAAAVVTASPAPTTSEPVVVPVAATPPAPEPTPAAEPVAATSTPEPVETPPIVETPASEPTPVATPVATAPEPAKITPVEEATPVIETSAPAEPAATPEAAPVATTPEIPAAVSAAETSTAAAGPMTTAEEEAAMQAQIDSFAKAPTEPVEPPELEAEAAPEATSTSPATPSEPTTTATPVAPATPEPTAAQTAEATTQRHDEVMANAVNSLMENTESQKPSDVTAVEVAPAPEDAPATPAEPTALDPGSVSTSTPPEPVTSMSGTDANNDESVTIAHKKVIQPINDPTAKSDLNQLLAKEQAMEAVAVPPTTAVVNPETAPYPEAAVATATAIPVADAPAQPGAAVNVDGITL